MDKQGDIQIDLGRIKGYLHSKGIRFTSQRRKVARLLLSFGSHLSADEIADKLKAQGLAVSKATVYRTLSLMKKSGLFEEHDFGAGRKCYEYKVDRPHHDHLYCIKCMRVIEFNDPALEQLQKRITRRFHFASIYHSHKIFGYCWSCRKGFKGASTP
jgi:Fur family ferric uptake transcriptional regulator